MECKKAEILNEKVKEISFSIFCKYTEECMESAKKNWTPQQVQMLDDLFNSVAGGFEYKCARCSFLGKPSDAPEDAPLDCMWHPSEDNCKRPCDEE